MSTIVYLDDVDSKLYEFLKTKVSDVSSFRMVRYVDDLYILIASDKSLMYLGDTYNEIRNEYSSILKEYGLSLNTKKCCIKKSSDSGLIDHKNTAKELDDSIKDLSKLIFKYIQKHK